MIVLFLLRMCVLRSRGMFSPTRSTSYYGMVLQYSMVCSLDVSLLKIRSPKNPTCILVEIILKTFNNKFQDLSTSTLNRHLNKILQVTNVICSTDSSKAHSKHVACYIFHSIHNCSINVPYASFF